MEASASGVPAADQASARRKTLILVAAILGTTVVTVDSTVVNVALPAIADDLGGGLAGQQWTANAYLVTLGSLLLIGGSLGDILGERRVFAFGVLAFGATSLLCALAPTIEVLVAARALQGVAGALLTPAALAVIVTIVLILRVVPAGRERDPGARVDVVGALLCALGLAGVTFGLIEQPLRGWGDPVVAVTLIGGALLFAGFLFWESRAPHPMLPLSLFKRHNFTFGNIETFAVYGGLGLLFFFLVLFLQQVAGYSALAAGSSSIPVTLILFALSMRFGMLADRHGPRFFMGVGPLVAAVGLALFMRLDADVDYVTDLLPGLLVFALGLTIVVAPLTATVLADADEHNAGIASGVNNAIARAASLIAIAAVGALVAASFGASLREDLGAAAQRPAVARAIEEAERQPLATVAVDDAPPDVRAEVARASEDASVEAFRTAIAIATGLVALGGLLGLFGIVNPRRRVEAADCPGGQLAGVPKEAAGCEEPRPPRSAVPARG